MTRERAVMLGLSACAFGVSTLMRKLAVGRLHPLQFQVLAAALYTLMLPAFVWMWLRCGQTVKWDLVGALWVIGSTIIASAAAIIFMFVLRGGNDVGVAAVLVSASPIVTVLLSVFLLGEELSVRSVVGMLLVIAGIVLVGGK